MCSGLISEKLEKEVGLVDEMGISQRLDLILEIFSNLNNFVILHRVQSVVAVHGNWPGQQLNSAQWGRECRQGMQAGDAGRGCDAGRECRQGI